MRLADVGGWIEHVRIGRGDIHVPEHDGRLRPGPDETLQRSQPLKLVPVVIRVGFTAVRYVDGGHPDAIADRRDRPRLRVRKPGCARQALLYLRAPDPGQDRDAV